MDEQRIEAAAKAMYDAVLSGAGSADDFNSRPPEVRAIWLSAARAAYPHLAQDEGLTRAEWAEWLFKVTESQVKTSVVWKLADALVAQSKIKAALAAPLRVAREGYVSIEDVQKVVRAEIYEPMLRDQIGRILPIEKLLDMLRSRLTQPRSAEERVTVFTQGCGCCFVVSQDGIAQKQFTGGDPAKRDAEIYADGLRARLDGEGKHGNR